MRKKLQLRNLALFSLVALFLVGVISTYAVAQVKMRLWEWSRAEHPEQMQAIYGEFERRYNVKLEISSPNYYELAKKLLIAAEAAEVPDLMELWASGDLPLLAQVALECLDPYLDKEGLRDKYDSRFLPTYRGKIYSLPLGGAVMGLLYNKDMFQKAGIARPPRTWEQLVLIAQKLTHPEKGEYGLVMNGSDDSLVDLGAFIASNGSHLGKFNGKIWINSPESVEAVQFIIDLNNKYKVMPFLPEMSWKTSREMFKKQKTAMIVDASWVVPHYVDAPFEWAITTFPERKWFGYVSAFDDTMYGMSRRTPHKDLAWEFLKYMTANEETVSKMAGFEFKLPGLKAVWEKKEFKENPYLRYSYEYLESGVNVNGYTDLPYQRTKAIDIFKRLLPENGASYSKDGKRNIQSRTKKIGIPQATSSPPIRVERMWNAILTCKHIQKDTPQRFQQRVVEILFFSWVSNLRRCELISFLVKRNLRLS